MGRYTVRGLAWLFFNCKQLVGRLPRLVRGLLRPPLRLFASGSLAPLPFCCSLLMDWPKHDTAAVQNGPHVFTEQPFNGLLVHITVTLGLSFVQLGGNAGPAGPAGPYTVAQHGSLQ